MVTSTEPITDQDAPDSNESAQAAHVIEFLHDYLTGHEDGMSQLQLRLPTQPGGQMIVLPESVVAPLREILAELVNGNSVMVVPVHSEITSQQAAELLNVSRPFLVGLLDKGEIPFRRVGNRRRIKMSDILSYKHQSKIRQQQLLDELTAEAQKLGLEY